MRSVVLIFAPPEWGEYWARYLKVEAESSGKELSVTEMWDKPQNLQLWYGADRDFFSPAFRNTGTIGRVRW